MAMAGGTFPLEFTRALPMAAITKSRVPRTAPSGKYRIR
jgi:hypothetical protein